eukprot:g1531.t1
MSAPGCDESFGFHLNWYDSQAELTRRYRMTYFVRRGESPEIELYDLKTKRCFLKRTPYEGIKRSDLYIGARVIIYSRQMEIVDFADPYTRSVFSKSDAFCAVFINSYSRMGSIIEQMDKKFQLSRLKMVIFSDGDADQFSKTLQGQNNSLNGLTQGPCLVMELRHQNGLSEWKSFAARYGGLAYGGDFCDMFWGTGPRKLKCASDTTATLSNCTCCIVKPHAVKEKKTGSVISDVKAAGWEISALCSFQLDQGAAEEFMEVYQGVIPNFEKHVKELCSGTCVAMEIRPGPNQEKAQQNQNEVVSEFRKLTGPFEFEFAKQLRPNSLRAKYGVNQIQNAVHSTDLPDDGVLECEYLFGLYLSHQET